MRATGPAAGLIAAAIAVGAAACGAGAAPHGATHSETATVAMGSADASSAETAPAEAPPDVLAWMRAQAIPLSPPDSGGLLDGAEAANRLGALVGEARVVAIGEPAHGAHEPLALRNRLFRQLVEQQGFTVIALETGLTESRALDAYVRDGPGEAATVAREGFTWGFGEYPENVALLRWMREHNRNAAPERRLRLYGYDLSGGGGGGFPNARVALDSALEYLRRTAPDRAHEAVADTAPLAAWFDPTAYTALPEADRRRMAEQLDALADWLQRERAALVAASSEDEHDWALRNAWTAQRLAEALALLPPDPATAGIPPEMHAVMSQRDLAMADNLQWVLGREPGTARVLVFGHNAHVAATSIKGGLWSGLAQPPRMLGQHLRQRLGAGYVVVPVLAARNAEGLPAAQALPGALEETLARVGPAAFLLDLRGAPAPAAAWLAQERPVRANFATETWLRPAVAFDAVIHVETLHPAGGS